MKRRWRFRTANCGQKGERLEGMFRLISERVDTETERQRCWGGRLAGRRGRELNSGPH